MSRLLVALLLTAVVAAGCLGAQKAAQPVSTQSLPVKLPALTFLPAVTVDAARIASEPSVRLDAKGGIYVAAPTGTIKYATRPQDLATEIDKGAFQGAIWKSEDGGKTFKFLDSGNPVPYHTQWPGGGDSEIAIDPKGWVYVADQLGLVTESISYSTDGGKTWQAGSPDASGTVGNDRQWMWPTTKAGELWMVVDGQTNQGIIVSHTTDAAQNWQGQYVTPYDNSPGPITVINSGANVGVVAFGVYTPDSAGDPTVWYTKDQGKTWKHALPAVGHGTTDDFFPQTVADTAGNLYLAWVEKSGDGHDIKLAVSKDGGDTWSAPMLVHHQVGTAIFMSAVAGDAGRLGFSWYGAVDPDKEWYEESAVVWGADTMANMTHTYARVDPKPIRVGAPCQSGSTCTSGRELGDFQSVAVGPDGLLRFSYVHVLSAQDGGRVTFAQEDATGPKLFVNGPPTPWVV
ncbi:MAG: sialidase family protein [Thermoplasmatota archaeon]